MPTTSRLAIPYPVRANTADVPRDTEAIAVALDDITVVGYSGPYASRPAAGLAFRIWRATDLATSDPNHLTLDTGAAWESIAFTNVIPDRSIAALKLILGTITALEMDANSVGSSQLINGAVTGAKLQIGAVDGPQVADALKPSHGAADGTETLRALGTGTGNAAKGLHAQQHLPDGPDPLPIAAINPAYVTVLPVAPVDGQEIYYRADDTNNIVWHLRYKLSIARWEAVGEQLPLYIESSKRYTTGLDGINHYDSTIFVTAPLAGDYFVTIEWNGGSSGNRFSAGWYIGGVYTININAGGGNAGQICKRRINNLTAGTIIYFAYNANIGGGDPVIRLQPVKVS